MVGQPSVRRGGFVWPILLIFLGMVFLLNNLGLVSWSVWQTIGRLWPLLLVAIGLELVLTRGSGGGIWAIVLSVLILIAVLGAVGAVLYFIPVGSMTVGPRIGQSALVETSNQALVSTGIRMESISQSLEDAEQADVELDLGVGLMKLRASAEPASLIEGNPMLGDAETVSQNFYVSRGIAHYRLDTKSAPFFHGPGSYRGDDRNWDLKLSPAVPMKLRINGGVGSADLDLSKLRVTDLTVRTGVSDTTLMLPGAGASRVSVDGGIGKTTIYVPRGAAARLQVEKGLTSVDVSGSFRHQGDNYVSPGYDGAQERMNVTIKGGIGKIVVLLYDPLLYSGRGAARARPANGSTIWWRPRPGRWK
jgi:hypothetical protein